MFSLSSQQHALSIALNNNNGKSVFYDPVKTVEFNNLNKIEEEIFYRELDSFELKNIKENKKNEIRKHCDDEIVGGFYSFALGEEYFYYSSVEEQSTINSVLTLGISSEFKAQKAITTDGIKKLGARTRIEHTYEQLKDVLLDGALHIGKQVRKKDSLIEQVENATNQKDISNIKW